MRDHELAGTEIENVELDQVDAYLDRRSEGSQRVLGRQSRGTSMTDPERPSVTPLERDHGLGLVGR